MPVIFKCSRSTHNSGVIHAGVYYAPGSLKARYCREGAAATYRFAREHGLPVEQCGKLIVATSAIEVDRLKDLHGRASANGLEPEWIGGARLRELEPKITGLAAVRVALHVVLQSIVMVVEAVV